MSTLAAIFAALTLVTTGAMTGLFFAFSTSVMPGLDALRADQAIRAFQSMNRKILNPLFLVTFIGAPIAAAVTGVLLLVEDQASAAVALFLTAAVYLLGALLPTAAINIPMNNALDATEVPTNMDEATRIWSGFSPRWTRWNTARTLFCLASLLLTGLALFAWGREW